MTYLELLQALEEKLGNHQLPLNPAPSSLKNLFDSTPLHHEAMTQLVRALFAGNGCGTLTDPVEREASFDAIAPVRTQWLQSKQTDIDLQRMLDEFVHALDAVFGPAPTTNTTKKNGDVIELARYRRWR